MDEDKLKNEQDIVRARSLSVFSFETVKEDEGTIHVLAGSRNRYLSVEKDNFGFARYAHAFGEYLYGALGVGQHFGEWYGAGIQRRYGLEHKRFALFDARRWKDFGDPEKGHTNEPFMNVSPVDYLGVPQLSVVPTLHVGPVHSVESIRTVYGALRAGGSKAVPGFDKPEGIVVHFTAFDQLVKITDAEQPKPPKKERRSLDLPPENLKRVVEM